VVGGVALPGQKVFGLWKAAWITASRRRSRRAQRAVALLNGASLAGAVTHYVAWPIRCKAGLPVLQEGAEGLTPGWTRWYNVLLYAWGISAAAAVFVETPREVRPWGLAGFGAMPLVAVASHRKHDWAREQARLRPRWWNRALRIEGKETSRAKPAVPNTLQQR
jgi:hypothetical protein